MIVYVSGGLFTSPAGTLVNTVNTAGVMGKGIAKAFKAFYPDMFDAYAARCEAGDLVPGSLLLWRTPHKQVMCLPTKRHWRSPSRLEDIEAALRTVAANWAAYGLTSVAFPQLGCGNGGLDWEREVRPLMERWLLPLPIVSYIHVSDGTVPMPDKAETKAIAAWLAGEPVSLAFAPFADDLRAAAPAIDEEASHRLWTSLDATGFVLREDVPAWLDADATLEALAGLPYLQRARAVAITSPGAYDAAPTAELLAGVAAEAVRLSAMDVPASHRPRVVTMALSAHDQDGSPWAHPPASPTPTQSELSFSA